MYQVSEAYTTKMFDQVQTHRLIGQIDSVAFYGEDVIGVSYTNRCSDKNVNLGSVNIGVLKREDIAPIAGARSVKIAEDKIKCQLTKYQMCMGCRACEGVCKHDAIALLEMPDGGVRYQIREDKCVRCGECVNHFIGGCYIRKVLAIKR